MNNYILAIQRPWTALMLPYLAGNCHGKWHTTNIITTEYAKQINPRYIFFPHWSDIVPDEIINEFECICFHETDLPFGAGGSPVQNLISMGITETKITALRMTSKIDGGPVYLKHPMSLHGTAEEIYIRSSAQIAEMIAAIIRNELKPSPQTGERTVLKRRTPAQSEIKGSSLNDIYNHIRMLDADGYPKAFIIHDGFRYEFTRASVKTNKLIADVTITKI